MSFVFLTFSVFLWLAGFLQFLFKGNLGFRVLVDDNTRPGVLLCGINLTRYSVSHFEAVTFSRGPFPS